MKQRRRVGSLRNTPFLMNEVTFEDVEFSQERVWIYIFTSNKSVRPDPSLHPVRFGWMLWVFGRNQTTSNGARIQC